VNLAYGATLPSIIGKLNSDPIEYGSVWGNSKNLAALIDQGAALDAHVSLLKRLRDEYLPICRALADEAFRRDPYAGVSFRGTFDGVVIRWDAPERQQKEIPHGALPLSVSLPVGTPNAAGDYPVDLKKLRKRIAPSLIHGLDADLSARVIKALHDHGVHDVINVYDGWLVPSNVAPLLYEVVKNVTEPWLRGLGPFYDVFEQYLGEHPMLGPIVRGWREAWCRRVAAGNDWPVFLMKQETTHGLVI
jgi:hypothetical protein